MESSENTPAPAPSTGSSPASGLTPNVAAALAYILGFVSGVVFYLISKDKFVRFHAIQSIITSLGLWGVNVGLGLLPGLYALTSVVTLVTFILFIFLIVKAYQGEKFKLPVIGDYAEKYA